MRKKEIAVYGASGFGREVVWLVESCSNYEVICFIDDDVSKHGIVLNDIPVMSLEETCERFPEAFVVGGVGNPKTRQVLMEKAIASGFRFETIIRPRVERSRWIEVGEGTVICAGSILTTNITLGKHVQINNALTWEEKFELDVWYVDNWSLGLDLKIIGMTVLNVLKREGITAVGEATMPEFNPQITQIDAD